MIHPIPTAAPIASPPPRGEGMGVGGCPSRPLRARICRALFPTLFLATQASAQIIPTGTPAADILLSQAIAEHRTFLTCSALDPATHAQITQNWQRDVTAATAILTANKVPPEAITAFTTAADPANLVPTDDTPWAEVQGLCATQPDWAQRYFDLNLILLELRLPAAFP